MTTTWPGTHWTRTGRAGREWRIGVDVLGVAGMVAWGGALLRGDGVLKFKFLESFFYKIIVVPADLIFVIQEL